MWLALAIFAGVLLMRSEAGERVQVLLRGVLQTISLVPIGQGFRLRADAAVAFLRMAHAAGQENVAFHVNSAWRSNAEQAELRAKYDSGERTAATAKEGFSNHEAGLAVDIETAKGTNAAFRWLTKHAFQFGFYRTVASEPWHWEFKS